MSVASAGSEREEVELSIVIPCLNEVKTLPLVIEAAKEAVANRTGEVIVADNGSTDGSQELALSLGVRVVDVPLKGYGSALTGGIEASVGRYILIGDADCSYDFAETDRFVDKLKEGYEYVIGTRLKGTIDDGAMPNLHRYLGTPVLTWLVNLFFGTGISDVNCGIRAFTRDAFNRMDIHATGMEWASETTIKAGLLKMKIAEVPATLHVDKRDRKPHLRPWRDGWHHLRFILTYAADKLFMLPGLLLCLAGFAGFCLLLAGPVTIGNFFIDYHFLFPSSIAIILGVQLILSCFLIKTYTGLASYDMKLQKLLRIVSFESGIVFGCILILLGLAINCKIVYDWLMTLGQGLFAVRPALAALTLMAVGTEICFNSFFMSVMKIPVRVSATPG
ncbi:MAG: glycosyltransferase family 2 protein [Candidatus Obscuribacterales bacterium]|nr:glycosyltransferase family 2 protein [Candidatus Obscuribacterales bacterium]